MWRRKIKKRKKFTSTKKWFNIVIGSFLALGLIGYIIQSNGIATKGYFIQELEEKIEELNRMSRELENKSLELQSLSSVTSKLKHLKLVESDEAIYMYPDSKTVLKR